MFKLGELVELISKSKANSGFETKSNMEHVEMQWTVELPSL
jgi:hypothetical protein